MEAVPAISNMPLNRLLTVRAATPEQYALSDIEDIRIVLFLNLLMIYSAAHGRKPRTSGHAKRYVIYADCTPCENWLYIR